MLVVEIILLGWWKYVFVVWIILIFYFYIFLDMFFGVLIIFRYVYDGWIIFEFVIWRIDYGCVLWGMDYFWLCLLGLLFRYMVWVCLGICFFINLFELRSFIFFESKYFFFLFRSKILRLLYFVLWFIELE